MSAELTMPRLSDTMTEGTVLRWLRGHGDEVEQGDSVVEIETDKVTTELTAPVAGVLHVVTDEGVTVGIGTILAHVGQGEEFIGGASTGVQTRGDPAADGRTRIADTSRGLIAAAGSPILRSTQAVSDTPPAPRVRATPLARRMAREAGIEVAAIAPGSGPRGRVQKTDVERFMVADGQDPAARDPVPAVNGEAAQGKLIARGRIHDVIARRMSQAKREVPHFYVSVGVDFRRAIRLRNKLVSDQMATRISLTDLIVQACARALRAVPQVNASWEEAGVRIHDAVNIGLAVALENEALIVPVLREADRLTLADIAGLRVRLIERARSQTITPDDLDGATFTVSNLGMFGVEEFHAIINPPQGAILAVGAVEDRVIARHGRPTVRPMTTLSLSADHRIYSGATAASFLTAVKAGLQQPLQTLAGVTVTGR